MLIPWFTEVFFWSLILNHEYKAKHRVLKLLVGQCKDQVLALSSNNNKKSLKIKPHNFIFVKEAQS